jgi:hypothetical protein
VNLSICDVCDDYCDIYNACDEYYDVYDACDEYYDIYDACDEYYIWNAYYSSDCWGFLNVKNKKLIAKVTLSCVFWKAYDKVTKTTCRNSTFVACFIAAHDKGVIYCRAFFTAARDKGRRLSCIFQGGARQRQKIAVRFIPRRTAKAEDCRAFFSGARQRP